MGRKKRIREERAAGLRRPPDGQRNKEPTAVEQWRQENRKAFREMRENGFKGVDGLEGFDPQETGSTASLFEPEPTDEPGTMYECEDCKFQGYVEGIFATGSSPNGIQASEMVMFGACPECHGNMYSISWTILNGPEGGISASHPAGLRAALEMLLERLESGEVTADEAVEELRKEPMFRRILDRLEAHPVTVGLVTGVIYIVLKHLGLDEPDKEPPPAATFTPAQVEQIIDEVVSHVEEADTPDNGRSPQVPPGRQD